MDELLERCREGDNEAIATLVRRYRTRAVDLAAAILKDDHLADDAVQEAFVIALDRLGDLREPSAFAAWFRQIVRRQCYRMLRRSRGGPVMEMVDVPGGVSPDERILREERSRAVRDALASLPPVCGQTARMFYLEERDCSDIGHELNVPVGTVRRRLHDARKRLRDMFLGDIPDVPRKDRR